MQPVVRRGTGGYMEKYEFNENPYQKAHHKRLPENVSVLLSGFWKAGKTIKELSGRDSGFKNGIKTTSYCYEYGGYKWSYWQGDCEQHYSLFHNDTRIGSHYDCYGAGWFEFADEAALTGAIEDIGRMAA